MVEPGAQWRGRAIPTQDPLDTRTPPLPAWPLLIVPERAQKGGWKITRVFPTLVGWLAGATDPDDGEAAMHAERRRMHWNGPR